MTSKSKLIIKILSFIFLFFSFFFIEVMFWVPSNFGDISFSQIIFHLTVPLEGADNTFIYSFILHCVLLPLCLSALLFFVVYKKKGFTICYSLISKKTGKKYSISISKIVNKFFLSLTIISVVVSSSICIFNIGLYDYLKNLSVQSKIYSKYYVNPKDVTFQFPQQKRNLIYIYMESMETTYYSKELGGMQNENLIPELYKLAETNVTFDNGENENKGFYVPEGAGWTAGAMVAQSTGLPLKIPVSGNAYDSKNFLPGSYSIGEVLQTAGYNQELLIGSDALFGGRKYFYKKHGNYNIVDYKDAIKQGWIDEDYYVWWGYEDEKLYENAKKELTNLSSKEAPFNLTMLTADTHHIGGYKCPLCPDLYDNDFENVIACASIQVSNFIDWIKTQPYYENTTIVICGDHLSMDPTYFENIDANYFRKGFYTFINPGAQVTNASSRKITTFDLFPTTVASLGITFDKDRLGLGTNLFSNAKTLLEIYGWDKLQEELQKNSSFYDKNILYAK